MNYRQQGPMEMFPQYQYPEQQQVPSQQFHHGFPGYPGPPHNPDRRLDRLEREVQQLNRQVNRLERRVDRLERQLGFGQHGRPELSVPPNNLEWE